MKLTAIPNWVSGLFKRTGSTVSDGYANLRDDISHSSVWVRLIAALLLIYLLIIVGIVWDACPQDGHEQAGEDDFRDPKWTDGHD